MAINSKDIETLWKQYSETGVAKGISVAQYFESNGVPYHTFEKWYKKKYSQSSIVDCVVSSDPDGSLPVFGGGNSGATNTDKRGGVYVSYVNIGLSNGIKVEHHRFPRLLNSIYIVVNAIESEYLCEAKVPYYGRSTYRHRANDNASPVRDAAGIRGIGSKGWPTV